MSAKLPMHDRAAISRLFSASVARELAATGRSPLFARLVLNSGVLSDVTANNVGDVFEHSFSFLSHSSQRDEYVYRNALVNKILIGRHTLRTATVLNEFRVGGCKVDLAILNGTSTAYEIKSERDTLARLDSQLSAYRDFFAKTFVIAGENHAAEIERSVPDDVGILTLTNRGRISTLRDAVDRSGSLQPFAILDALRTSEAKFILMTLGRQVPDGPNTLIREMLREEFCTLSSAEVHGAMVATLKCTRSAAYLSDFVSALPKSLAALVLKIQPTASDCARLVNASNTRLDEALNWA